MDEPMPLVNRPCHVCQSLARRLYGQPRVVAVASNSVIRDADGPDGLCRYHRTTREDQS